MKQSLVKSLLYSPMAIACKMHYQIMYHVTQNIHSMVRYQRNKVYLETSQRSQVRNLVITDLFIIKLSFNDQVITES